jgi:hypothetical protein
MSAALIVGDEKITHPMVLSTVCSPVPPPSWRGFQAFIIIIIIILCCFQNVKLPDTTSDDGIVPPLFLLLDMCSVSYN